MKKVFAAIGIVLTACALTYGGGNAEAEPTPDFGPLAIYGSAGCPSNGVVIASGTVPASDRYTLEVLNEETGMWAPLQTKYRESGDIVNLEPRARMWPGDTKTFRVSSPLPKSQRGYDDTATPIIRVEPTIITAPICD